MMTLSGGSAGSGCTPLGVTSLGDASSCKLLLTQSTPDPDPRVRHVVIHHPSVWRESVTIFASSRRDLRLGTRCGRRGTPDRAHRGAPRPTSGHQAREHYPVPGHSRHRGHKTVPYGNDSWCGAARVPGLAADRATPQSNVLYGNATSGPRCGSPPIVAYESS